MAKMYYENDADMSLLEGRTIGVIGYGSQGHAHALNLKDSGVDVMVGLYEGSGSWPKAEADGLKVGTVAETAEGSEIVMVLIPDHLQGGVYKREIEPHMGPDKTLMFAHGFNIHYETIVPPDSIDVSMVAPKAPGHRMREVFTRGSGVPGAACDPPGRVGQGARDWTGLREGRRLHQGRRAGHDIQGGRRRPTCSESSQSSAAASQR